MAKETVITSMIENKYSQMTEWLTFTLGDEIYGIEVLSVLEVLPCTEASPVLGALAKDTTIDSG